MNDELRKEIIQYRMESAEALLKEIDTFWAEAFTVKVNKEITRKKNVSFIAFGIFSINIKRYLDMRHK